MKLHVSVEARVAAEEPLGLLVACHARIRSFTALAQKLAVSKDAQPKLVTEAAADLLRYFTVAYPLHSTDEEQLLEPKLRRSPRAEVQHALDQLEADHRACDALLDELVPTWRTLAAPGPHAPELFDGLVAPSKSLEERLLAHLKMEEDVLFPEARTLLTSAEHQALNAAIRERQNPADRA